ncbi:esterase family protein [Nocardia sp. NEAU-G5]|uniref:Esterase family protein n=1 Tax=Nocardia albiluteola TaxID=2842303 RepID=A0ABS6B1A5_9NOCA|nr:alpha/beta hydrolase family protein [Nocardia albiluteola]MBU3063526.1 esterase family protein [Nocardia albiluteola]
MRRVLHCLFVAIAGIALLIPGVASADAGRGPAVLDVRPLGGRQYQVVVYSAAMNKPITLWVSHPDGPAPALYLLNAVDGGEAGGPWNVRTDAARFFADKNVNVIVPIGGRASYYTDWAADDPALGRNQWSTFLIHELPPLLNARFGMTGRNAVAGVSMSGTSALDLAIEAPGLYQAAGVFSGCPSTSDPAARAMVYSQLASFGADAANMWGPPGSPAWVAHDPALNAARLRGVALYVSVGNGVPGAHDTLADPSIGGNVGVLTDRLLAGGALEGIANGCTHAFTARLAALGIPATEVYRGGTHSWPYWQEDLHDSWRVFAPALGA